ncbi:MAG: IS200/IS605 family transposase, partial [Elainellaceae cyanobacterium]
HLVLVTKYRLKIIDKPVQKRLYEIFAETCEKWRSSLTEVNGEADHVHLRISYPPDVQISKLVNNLKTVSSRLIRKEFEEPVAKAYRKRVFWSGAYFVASTGGVTLEQVKAYVENQPGVEPN